MGFKVFALLKSRNNLFSKLLKETLGLKENTNKLVDTSFMLHLNQTPDGKTILNRLLSDDAVLHKLGINPPEPENRTNYYRIMHNHKNYHVFDAS